MNLVSALRYVIILVEKNIVKKLRKNRFKIGDMIVSACGDYGLVLKTGLKPNDGGSGKMGVYAHWAKEKLSFWMDMDEPEIELYAQKEKKNEC